MCADVQHLVHRSASASVPAPFSSADLAVVGSTAAINRDAADSALATGPETRG